MIGEPSIIGEAIRAELRHDCEAAGYSPADAEALAGRIIDGWVTPGLAVALDAGRGVAGETADAGPGRSIGSPESKIRAGTTNGTQTIGGILSLLATEAGR
jgi:hypothetical protein